MYWYDVTIHNGVFKQQKLLKILVPFKRCTNLNNSVVSESSCSSAVGKDLKLIFK